MGGSSTQRGGGRKVCALRGVYLPWVSKRGIWDVPGILPGCPGPLGVFKKFVQKGLCAFFVPYLWECCLTDFAGNCSKPEMVSCTLSQLACAFMHHPVGAQTTFFLIFVVPRCCPESWECSVFFWGQGRARKVELHTNTSKEFSEHSVGKCSRTWGYEEKCNKNYSPQVWHKNCYCNSL